jgi:2-polyprenyl-6-methoxyphenol hydroxylase-like FAD-dependent oxidoreductase
VPVAADTVARSTARREAFAVDGTTCCVAGGGPAGMMLGLLLARAGVPVTVLEKHDDFLRDFRGDTVHPSTLALLDELGLGDRFGALPQREVRRLALPLSSRRDLDIDLSRLPGPHRHIAMVPQWDLLDLLADAGRREPAFTLRMGVEVTDVIRQHGRIAGVRYRARDGSEGELGAALTVGCDGRSSVVRAAAGLPVREFGVPLDVWWFAVPRGPDDTEGFRVRLGGGALLVLIDRGATFQLGYVIRKGSDERLRDAGLDAFRSRVAAIEPRFAERVGAIASLEQVKLLTVRLNRTPRWFAPGLLCIGDAAHAMSPVGGVGINLAVQDAVAAARILAPALRRRGSAHTRELARVQARRWAPTVITQALQRLAHRRLIGPALAGAAADRAWLARALTLPGARTLVPRLFGLGVLAERAPEFARRAPAPVEHEAPRAAGVH